MFNYWSKGIVYLFWLPKVQSLNLIKRSWKIRVLKVSWANSLEKSFLFQRHRNMQGYRRLFQSMIIWAILTWYTSSYQFYYVGKLFRMDLTLSKQLSIMHANPVCLRNHICCVQSLKSCLSGYELLGRREIHFRPVSRNKITWLSKNYWMSKILDLAFKSADDLCFRQ